MEYVPVIIICCSITAYLIGSIPFGLILGRLCGVGDIRRIGSGNIGATNMMRTGRKGLGVLTFILDFAKGIAAIASAYPVTSAIDIAVNASSEYEVISLYESLAALILGVCCAPICAVVGHVFPIWLKFKGGKGVATALGVYMGMQIACEQIPYVSLITLLLWITAFKLTRYSSLSSILSLAVSPLLALAMVGPAPYVPEANIIFALLATVIAALVIYKHKGNIARLRAGTESKWVKTHEPS